MIHPLVLEALQTQFNKERGNHTQYAAFASALEAANWPGYSDWMQNASNDEWTHAQKFISYIIDRNETPVYTALLAPLLLPGDNPIPFFEEALKLEQTNTASILAINELADTWKDQQTISWLIWAIEEQTRSERELVDAVLELRRCRGSGLLILDREYGERS